MRELNFADFVVFRKIRPFFLLKKIFIYQDNPIDSESDYEDDDGIYLLFRR